MIKFTFYEIYKDVMEMLDDDATRGQFMKAICKFMFEEEPVKPPKGNKSEYFWENIIDVMTESKEAEKNGKRPKRLNMKMKHFAFQYAYYKAILLMTDEEKWQYIKAIYGYMVDGVESTDLSNNVALYFNLTKRKLDISKTRSVVGKHGGKSQKQTAEMTLEQFLSAHSHIRNNLYGSAVELVKGKDFSVLSDKLKASSKWASEQSLYKILSHYVLVYQLDRFARNRYDSANYKAKLKKNGVRVLSAKENISEDASGILIEGVLESKTRNTRKLRKRLLYRRFLVIRLRYHRQALGNQRDGSRCRAGNF